MDRSGHAGTSWTADPSSGKRDWASALCTADASLVVACAREGGLFVGRRASSGEVGTFALCSDSAVLMRTKPDLRGEIAGRLEKGDRVEILGRSAEKAKVGDMESYWLRVMRIDDGPVGWAYGYYLTPE